MSTTQAPTNEDGSSDFELNQLPIISNRFSELSDHFFTWQRGKCADYEWNFSRCAARVGKNDIKEKCKDFHDDFIECAYNFNSKKRLKAMEEERKRQGRPYLPPPEPDSIKTWLKKDN